MKFELSRMGAGSEPGWFWDVTVQGEVVATSPTGVMYATEAEARSAIAKARKAFAGAKFAKVVSPDDA